jgi:hypothetical protein
MLRVGAEESCLSLSSSSRRALKRTAQITPPPGKETKSQVESHVEAKTNSTSNGFRSSIIPPKVVRIYAPHPNSQAAKEDKTPPLSRQEKARPGSAAKTGRIASMFEKASSPCPGGKGAEAGVTSCRPSAPNFSGQPAKGKAAGQSKTAAGGVWPCNVDTRCNAVICSIHTHKQVRPESGGQGQGGSTGSRRQDPGPRPAPSYSYRPTGGGGVRI